MSSSKVVESKQHCLPSPLYKHTNSSPIASLTIWWELGFSPSTAPWLNMLFNEHIIWHCNTLPHLGSLTLHTKVPNTWEDDADAGEPVNAAAVSMGFLHHSHPANTTECRALKLATQQMSMLCCLSATVSLLLFCKVCVAPWITSMFLWFFIMVAHDSKSEVDSPQAINVPSVSLDSNSELEESWGRKRYAKWRESTSFFPLMPSNKRVFYEGLSGGRV